MSRTYNAKQRGFRDLKSKLYKSNFHLICVDDIYHTRKKDRTKNRVLRKRLMQEKQQLISFLEDKIKECEKEIEEFLVREDFHIALDKKEAFQEVLDFVNKGGKDE